MNDINAQIIALDQQKARLSFQIKNALNPVDKRDLELIQERDKLKAQIDALTAQVHNRLPDYIPLPRVEKMVINPRDLVAEHNARYATARLAVSKMKLENKWQGTYYDPLPAKKRQNRCIVEIEVYRDYVVIKYNVGRAKLYRYGTSKFFAAIRLANSNSFKTTMYMPWITSGNLHAIYEVKDNA